MDIQKRRRSFWSCIAPILTYYLCQIVAYVIMAIVYSVKLMKTVDLNQTYEKMMDSVMEQLMQKIDLISYESMLLAAVIAIPILLRKFKKDNAARKLIGMEEHFNAVPYKWYFIPVIMGASTAIAGNNMITMSGLEQSSEAFVEVNEVLTAGSFGLQILGVGLLVPIVEELLFRGIIYKRMKEIMPTLQAGISCALLFGVLHANIVQGIYGFCIGILMCLVYERFHSLVAPILMHVSANLVVVLAAGFNVGYQSLTMFYLITLLMCVLVIVAVWMLEAYVRPLNPESNS